MCIRDRSKDAANRYFARFIRRFRAARKKRGAELQYIYVTEGYHEKRANDWLVEDGTLEDRRIHHHVVINATDVDDLEEIRSLWQGGGYIRAASNSSEASEVTIDDEEVPLAPGPGNQGGSSNSIGWWIAGGGVLLFLAVALINGYLLTWI